MRGEKAEKKKKTFIFVVYSLINNNIMIFTLLSLDKKNSFQYCYS